MRFVILFGPTISKGAMRTKAEMLMHNYYTGASVPSWPDDINACVLASIVADLIGGDLPGHFG
jgi:hypothetical protein